MMQVGNIIMPIQNYVNIVKKRYDSGISTEHSYRGDFQNLLQELAKGFTITNEPKRQKCGAPDFIVQNKEVPIGYIEAKDIGENLHVLNKSDLEQRNRYIASLDNIIFTDYLEFQFYKYGQKVKEIKIASIENNKVKPVKENFDLFITYIKDFCEFQGQTIKSSEKLAKMMAQKARMMEEVIYNVVKFDVDDNTLKDQLKTFKQILIHDLDEKTFADIYAQTIAYGLFAARLHDETLNDFSRQEARELIPKSNPFLRNLFDYISGAQLDDRVVWIVNDLADIFRATDVKALMEDFGKSTQQNDPFIHFYETFLGEYDPKLKKSRGVYYTPEPVVNFIVRAVDDILKSEFKIADGLADTSKIEKTVEEEGHNKKVKKQFHKVQILDPATGTGTFLAEVVKQIYKKFEGQEGIWTSYVENHLIPRLNGFEILMASYSMCHLKLEMMFREAGYNPKNDKIQPRLRVFLTNSLEEAHPDSGSLFASWLSREATEANIVKRDTPVMVVLGNPPYSVSSSNKSKWIEGLMQDYKLGLTEKNIQPLSDDYLKFIRFGQYFIDNSGEGILAYISNNSFIDGLIHRQMRNNLLSTFDKIYIIDLHGNSNRNEKTLNGDKDENVFDIQQGVSINIFVKTNKKKKGVLAAVKHFDYFGTRNTKYTQLINDSIQTIKWTDVNCDAPQYFFVPKDINSNNEYLSWISLSDLFVINTTGIKTHDDGNLVSMISFQENNYNYDYRPFDIRFINYDLKKVVRARYKVMKHMLEENISLIIPRQAVTDKWNHVQVSKYLSDNRIHYSNKGIPIVCPLYIYSEEGILPMDEEKLIRKPNLDAQILNTISHKISLKFTFEKEFLSNTFSPIDILDYIYAVLHSPIYRETYKEFLKIDFPRVPYPKDAEYFWRMVEVGKQLREIHLLESPLVQNYITKYPIDGDNEITNIVYQDNRVKINDIQYFEGVPQIAWDFYIGGYQPAQKWLKDRKGRVLSFEDIQHYRKIIVVLIETDKLMKEIDKIIEI